MNNTLLGDVLRYLVRRVGTPDELTTRDLLLSIEGGEAGFDNLEKYKAKLKADEDRANKAAADEAAAEVEKDNKAAAAKAAAATA